MINPDEQQMAKLKNLQVWKVFWDLVATEKATRTRGKTFPPA